MRTGLLTILVLAVVSIFFIFPAQAETGKTEQITVQLDAASQLIDAGRYDEAIKQLEDILHESPSNSRGLKLYLKANKAKHEAEKKAAEVRRKVEDQRAMKEVDEASHIPKKVYTDEPPVKTPNRPSSKLSQEMQELLNQRISMNLIDADLSYILNLLFTTTGINIIADRDLLVDKRLDIHVENAKLVDLLDYISTNAGISYTVNDSGIWITTPTQPQLEIRVFHLRYGITRTGQPIQSDKIENTASSSSFTNGTNNNNSTRSNRSFNPYSYRRFYRKNADDNISVEDVPMDSKASTRSYSTSSNAYRTQMLNSLSQMMRMRGQQPPGPNPSTNNNNSNNGGTNTANSGRTGDEASDMEKLLEWMAGWSGSMAWPEGSNYRFDLKTNSIVVVSTAEMLDKIGKMIEEFDIPPIQVNIRTRFITVKVQDGVEWGIEGILKSALGQGGDGTSNRTQFDAGSGWNLGVPSGDGTSGAAISFSGVLTDPQYNIVMNALRTQLNGRLLSEPNVTTLSNEPARLVVAEEFPYPTDWEPIESTVTDEGATTSNTTGYVPTDFETENIGITLDVLPSVGTEIDTIILELHPQIVTHDPNKDASYNIITTNSDGQAESFEVTRPTFARQEIVAKVVIRSGQTVVLGGLIDEEDVVSVSKVPLLGDIPGLGALFSRKTTTKARSNLLIFVTAEIVDTRGRFYHPDDKEGTSKGKDILPDILPTTAPEKKPENAEKDAETKVEKKAEDTSSSTSTEGDARKTLRKLTAQRTGPRVTVKKKNPPKIGRRK